MFSYQFIIYLFIYYRFNICIFFTDKGKMDQMLQETTNLRQMTNQVAYKTFNTSGFGQRSFPKGPKVNVVYF